MYEYAVSAGPGTLIDYGRCREIDFVENAFFINNHIYTHDETVIFEACTDSCETGK
jgi:hypothetical protein